MLQRNQPARLQVWVSRCQVNDRAERVIQISRGNGCDHPATSQTVTEIFGMRFAAFSGKSSGIASPRSALV